MSASMSAEDIASLPVPHMAVAAMEYWTEDMRWQAFEWLAKQRTMGYIHVSMVSICVWEHMLLMPAEIRVWRLLFAGQVHFPRVSVLIARYTVLTLMACCTVIFSGQPRDCKKTMASALALYLCSWVSCASVFVCRLNIIYSGRRSVVGGFAFLLCSCLGASIAIILSGYSFSELPPLWQFPYGPKCYVWVRPHIAALSWLISAIFDAAILVATLIRLRQLKAKMKGRGARIHLWLWQSSMTYFTMSSAIHFGCWISQQLISDLALVHIPSVIAFGCRTIIASRLVLSSKGWVSDHDATASMEWAQDAQDLQDAQILPTKDRGNVRIPPGRTITFERSIQERVEFRPRAGGNPTPTGRPRQHSNASASQTSTRVVRPPGVRLARSHGRVMHDASFGRHFDQQMICLEPGVCTVHSSMTNLPPPSREETYADSDTLPMGSLESRPSQVTLTSMSRIRELEDRHESADETAIRIELPRSDDDRKDANIVSAARANERTSADDSAHHINNSNDHHDADEVLADEISEDGHFPPRRCRSLGARNSTRQSSRGTN